MEEIKVANNQHINKVILNGTTLMDVSQTTVAADKLLKGYTAIGPNGQLVEGSFDVDTIISKLNTLQSDVTNIKTNSSDAKTNTDDIKTDVTTIKTNVNNLVNSSGTSKPTLIFKHNNGLAGSTVTIVDDSDYSNSFTMPSSNNDYVVELPHLGMYDVWYTSAAYGNCMLTVDVNAIGGIMADTWFVKPFSKCTPAEIGAYTNAHYAGDIEISDYWSLGDETKIHVSAINNTSFTCGSETITAPAYDEITLPYKILSFNRSYDGGSTSDYDYTFSYDNGSSTTRKRLSILLGPTHLLKPGVRIGGYGSSSTTYTTNSNSNCHWKGSYASVLYNWLNTNFYNNLDEDVQAIIKTTNHYEVHESGSSSTDTEKIFIPSITEIVDWSSASAADNRSCKKFDYFTTPANVRFTRQDNTNWAGDCFMLGTRRMVYTTSGSKAYAKYLSAKFNFDGTFNSVSSYDIRSTDNFNIMPCFCI